MSIKTGTYAATFACLMASTALAATPPNVIIFLVDDMGVKDLAANSGPIPSPGVDALAKEGLKFNNFYATPYCTPSRDELLTGRYNQRNHLEHALGWNEHGIGIPDEDITLAETLKASGYRTSIIGKWHLGQDEKYSPTVNGFDYFLGMQGGDEDYVTHRNAGGILDWYRNTELLVNDHPEYSTNVFTREALAKVTDGDKPFFLYLPYQAVHVPYRSETGLTGNAAYKSIVQEMDASVKTIMDKVHTLKSETIVFFMSDNGGGKGHNGNLRGVKGSVYEGGIRAPMIASWPGHIRVGQSYAIADIFDLYPTILHLVGATKPEVVLDGIDLTPNLTTGVPVTPRRLFWRQDGDKAVRNGRWKLVVIKGKPAELYDLQTDPSEARNVARAHPKIVATEKAALAAWELKVE